MVRIIQNYTLHEIIGEGAYGKVYRSINKNDNKEYAVKVIEVRRFKENKKLEECTVNEINILTNIEKHEHIIKYIDMLKTPNNFYFVYEFCNGGTLEGMLRKERVVPQRQALLIFKQLIDAFQVLNKYNIMHRDLKPDNIFFSNGVVKLGDFGFCKSLEKANMTKTMLGSPIYMAPEILRGEIYSTKADIWSLGVVLYEMLYGFCPFESTTIPKLIEVLKETELDFPAKEQVSNETKAFLKRLLTKDPTRRIEWMELLSTKISSDGRLAENRTVLSLTQDTPLYESSRMLESGKITPIAAKDDRKEMGSTGSFSPPSHQYSDSSNGSNPSFAKKKAGSNFEASSMPYLKNEGSQSFKKNAVKEHSEIARGMQLSVDLAKSNDNNAVLFAYLILKKAEQRLMTMRDEATNYPDCRELVNFFNGELKEISGEVGKYGMSENLSNWKGLVKATGDFHRNFRAFYMMVCYLGSETPRQDLSHVEMQMEVRSRLQ